MRKEVVFIASALAVLASGIGGCEQPPAPEKQVASTPKPTPNPTETPPPPTATVEKTTQKYRPRGTFFIKDDDEERPGILLRRDPLDDLSPKLPAVFKGDIVMILEGPTPIKKWYGDEGRRFWHVKIVARTPASIDLVGHQQAEEGWISEDYLGDPFYSYSR